MKQKLLLNLLKKVIGALFKKNIIVFVIIICFCQSNPIHDLSYLSSNYIPSQESKLSFGANINYDDEFYYNFMFYNWITDNLSIDGSILFNESINDLNMKYSFSFSYAYNFKKKSIKNVLFNFGYNKSRFKENIRYSKSLGYGLIINNLFNKLWCSIYLGQIDSKQNFNRLSITFQRSFGNFIVGIGYKIISRTEDDKIEIPNIKFAYKL